MILTVLGFLRDDFGGANCAIDELLPWSGVLFALIDWRCISCDSFG